MQSDDVVVILAVASHASTNQKYSISLSEHGYEFPHTRRAAEPQAH